MAEENPRITAIDSPETSNLSPFVYRFQNAKVHKKDCGFYRLFIKKAKRTPKSKTHHCAASGSADRPARLGRAFSTFLTGVICPCIFRFTSHFIEETCWYSGQSGVLLLVSGMSTPEYRRLGVIRGCSCGWKKPGERQQPSLSIWDRRKNASLRGIASWDRRICIGVLG